MIYRHSRHAGNHADVLKHSVLALLLEALASGAEPLVYLESHAGAGRYDLGARVARGGAPRAIQRLWPQRALAPELECYFRAVAALNPDGGCRCYPGSPLIAGYALRPQDRLILVERETRVARRLRVALQRDPRVRLACGDGFALLPALAPRGAAPGIALIDPPYVDDSDYSRALACAGALRARWPAGRVALWYPLIHSQATPRRRLLLGLAALRRPVLIAELTLAGQTAGMTGSGVAVVNAPPQLEARLERWLPGLASALVGDGPVGMTGGAGGWRLDWLDSPTCRRGAD